MVSLVSPHQQENRCEKSHNYFCSRSPDGTCLLTNSNDNVLRFWDLPTSLYNKQSWDAKYNTEIDLKPAVTVKEGGTVYDYCWYPLMSSWDPPTCW